ncbi:MAG: LarC family nickel insertion protein [Coriobacteriales bacterium]|nr:LarC family nickel insertion protein [Coriobacteriales bacterium]
MILHFDFSTGASGDKMLGALLEVSEALGLAVWEDMCRVAASLLPGVTVKRTRVSASGIAATQIRVTEEHHAPHRHWSDIRAMIEACPELDETARSGALRAFEAVAHAEATVHDVDVDRVHFHEVGAADSIIDIVCTSFLMARLAQFAQPTQATQFAQPTQPARHTGSAQPARHTQPAQAARHIGRAPLTVYATPLALGNGTVLCAHGELPVPAPATAHLIKGLPVYASVHEGELTTPTGAALARSFVTHWEPLPSVRPLACGYGSGTRTLAGAANIVRVLACECLEEGGARADSGGATTGKADSGGATTGESGPNEATATEALDLALEGCALLETNIDHLSAETLAFVCEELMRAGALDVWQEPIVMKKGRLAVRLSALVAAGEGRTFAQRVMALTGTLGVRQRFVERFVAPREILTLETPYGLVPFKVARFVDPADLGDGDDCDDPDPACDSSADVAETAWLSFSKASTISWLRPEHDIVARIARERDLDYRLVYDKLTTCALKALDRIS